MNAKDYFVTDAYVEQMHKEKHHLSARVYFKLPNGKKVSDGNYKSSRMASGDDHLCNGCISMFICLKYNDGSLNNSSYVNECIKWVINRANGLLTYNPDWIPVFKLEKDYWIDY